MTGKRLLLVAEAVTLAHLARPLAFAKAAAARGWSVTLACNPRYNRFLGSVEGKVEPIASIEPRQFLESLRRGSRLYSSATLEAYVREELELFERDRPNLVVGDFRLSLSVSARLARIPYATITNAFWSPDYDPPSWPIPQLALTRFLPIPLAEAIFRLARPFAFAYHAKALNEVRRSFGLPSLGSDLRRVYTDGDFVLYADLPELFPIAPLPRTGRFLGPVLWEPDVAPPDWWSDGAAEDTIYVTLGSSGDAGLLPSVVDAVSELDVAVLVATAGATLHRPLPPNVHVAEYLPGLKAARKASLVICNGGSLTSYQALSAGVPIVGIVSNLDQFLNMQAIERVGAGRTVRADRLSPPRLGELVTAMLNDAEIKKAARQVALLFHRHSFADQVQAFLVSMAPPIVGRS
jgi:UDP:flavonoid glycosyltransferase YjiC (YdhE family)